MGYTTLTIRCKTCVRKYILFYADYLNEAWLSEVRENDTTVIVKQFRCKSTADLDHLVEHISKRGKIMNLSSSETAEAYLKILEKKLEKKHSSPFGFSLSVVFHRLWDKISYPFIDFRMAN